MLLAILALAAAMICTGLLADEPEPVASGQCGDSMTWSLSEDGVLSVTGSGEMYDFAATGTVAPWRAYQLSINTVSIRNGVNSIGTYAFYQCASLSSVTVPNSVVTIGEGAFDGYTSLENVILPQILSEVSSGLFTGCTSLKSVLVQSGVAGIGYNAFYQCRALDTFYYTGTLEDCGLIKVAEGNDALTSAELICDVAPCNGNVWRYMADGGVLHLFGTGEVTTTSVNADGITAVVIHDGITGIGSNMFKDYTAMTSADLGNTVTVI